MADKSVNIQNEIWRAKWMKNIDYYKTHKSHSEKSNMYLTYKRSRREVKENETQE